jgi:hypothetical protein
MRGEEGSCFYRSPKGNFLCGIKCCIKTLLERSLEPPSRRIQVHPDVRNTV